MSKSFTKIKLNEFLITQIQKFKLCILFDNQLRIYINMPMFTRLS